MKSSPPGTGTTANGNGNQSSAPPTVSSISNNRTTSSHSRNNNNYNNHYNYTNHISRESIADKASAVPNSTTTIAPPLVNNAYYTDTTNDTAKTTTSHDHANEYFGMPVHSFPQGVGGGPETLPAPGAATAAYLAAPLSPWFGGYYLPPGIITPSAGIPGMQPNQFAYQYPEFVSQLPMAMPQLVAPPIANIASATSANTSTTSPSSSSARSPRQKSPARRTAHNHNHNHRHDHDHDHSHTAAYRDGHPHANTKDGSKKAPPALSSLPDISVQSPSPELLGVPSDGQPQGIVSEEDPSLDASRHDYSSSKSGSYEKQRESRSRSHSPTAELDEAKFAALGNDAELKEFVTSAIASRRNIYVRGLPPQMTDDVLRKLCERHGSVLSAKAIVEQTPMRLANGEVTMISGHCKGYGFVMVCHPMDPLTHALTHSLTLTLIPSNSLSV